MTDWREHNGGPQPVADDVWVEAQWPFEEGHFSEQPDELDEAGELPWEGCKLRYRILNQHVIDAALQRGIELGLGAALKEAVLWVSYKQGDRIESAIRALDPETIAREAVLDQLTREAQADNMGYDND